MENKKERNEEPVIIRRAVIINDDDEKQDKKSKESSSGHVATQKPNKNKDYNIVYRDKPSKPLTVSELFGIPKKEKAKPAVSKQEPAPVAPKATETKKPETSSVTSSPDLKNTTATTSVAKNNSQNFSSQDKSRKR